MKIFRQATMAILFAAFSLTGRGAENPSSTLDSILQHVIDRAKLDADNDRAFNQTYSYSREKITEYRNGAGELKKREDKVGGHQPNPAVTPQALAVTADAASPKNAGISDTHSNVHGQAFKKNDFLLNEDLVKRFQFTLAGQEMFNGRQALMIDFVPVKKDLPEHNLKDRFINKASGRIWVDAGDFTLAKADLHLTKPVDVAFGLVGSIWKFDYGFERARTDDGFWFTSKVNWHLEGREVIVNRTVDYHEQTTNLNKISSIAVR
ncbi:MAG TPA: hypothetical protein VE344_06470 [Methylomirabilota bacterium]|nr:hypothetical protein [Methylomirabilota bacterium]